MDRRRGERAGGEAFRAVDAPVFTFVLVKLASRCNINCTYCYWFRAISALRGSIGRNRC
jgi:hypothetical protein